MKLSPLLSIHTLLSCLIGILSTAALLSRSDSKPLEYFLPNQDYLPGIVEPESFLGFEVGEWHARHDQVVGYIHELGRKSDRVQVVEIGSSHERRPLLYAIISSPENLSRLDSIRRQHLSWALSARDSPPSSEELPIIVNMGYGVHGDESSASNAALLVAYHLAAATSEEVKEFLESTVVLLDPCMNPDGFARFAQWANMHRGKHPIADSAAREHNAVWPGGRTNHYWFDLNRDWLLAQHPESQARLGQFHQWLPNVVTDFHEMSSDSTYFFQPGVPKRKHPLTPRENVEFTNRIAAFHAQALDKLGSLYFVEERFDDFYYGKGSTYPDAHGAVGILFEQASSRGHLRESIHGEFDFAFTIRNQVQTSLSTFKAIATMRGELLDYQREFFAFAQSVAKADPVQAYVFGSSENPSATWHVADILRRHNVAFYHLAQPLENRDYESGSAFVVPVQQPQYRLVKALFERRTDFEDNIFYDVSAWTLPLAAGVPFEELSAIPKGLLGDRVAKNTFPAGKTPATQSDYAYAFSWSDYYAPRLLFQLLDANVRCKVATRPFEAAADSGVKRFAEGSIIVPLGIQDKIDSDGVFEIIRKNAKSSGSDVVAISTGLTPRGIDLGSPSMRPLKRPRPLLLVGDDVRSYEAGEMWHLLDHRFDIPVALVEPAALTKIDLNRYTHILMPSGNYKAIGEKGGDVLRRWLTRGGVVVAIKTAAKWVAEAKLGSMEFPGENKSSASDRKEHKSANGERNSIVRRRYADFANDKDSRRTSGAIFRGLVDTTHPICFGVGFESIPLFRNSNLVMRVATDPYATPVAYDRDSLVAGYVHPEMSARIDGSAAVIAQKVGGGTLVAFADNPNFRAFWFGTNRLFLNALFFGNVVAETEGPHKGAEKETGGHVHSH